MSCICCGLLTTDKVLIFLQPSVHVTHGLYQILELWTKGPGSGLQPAGQDVFIRQLSGAPWVVVIALYILAVPHSVSI